MCLIFSFTFYCRREQFTSWRRLHRGGLGAAAGPGLGHRRPAARGSPAAPYLPQQRHVDVKRRLWVQHHSWKQLSSWRRRRQWRKPLSADVVSPNAEFRNDGRHQLCLQSKYNLLVRRCSNNAKEFRYILLMPMILDCTLHNSQLHTTKATGFFW